MPKLDHTVFVEEVDEVREGKKSGSSGQNDDSSGFGVDQLKAHTSRTAELHRNIDKL